MGVILTGGLLLCYVGVAVFAEEREQKEVIELGEIVVTATRTKRPLRDVTASVTVITRKDIEETPFERIEDILKITPGLEVTSRYGLGMMGGNRPVNLRGVGGYGNRTLVMVDGVPINNANYHWVMWSLIPKDSVERIEVIRGPFSALYGSNAMGGVINVITKEPIKIRETIIEGTYGSMNTWMPKIIQSGKIDKFGYYLSGEYEETDGYMADEPTMSYNIKRFQKEWRYSGKLTYDLENVSLLTLNFLGHNSERSAGREYLKGDVVDNHLSLNYSREGKRINWFGSLYINNGEMDYIFDSPMPPPAYTYKYWNETVPYQVFGGIIQPSISLADWNTLSFGMDYRHEQLDKEDKYFDIPSTPPDESQRAGAAEGKQKHKSIFLQEEISFFDKYLIVTFGGRYDWVKNYDGRNFDTNPPGPTPPYENDFPIKRWEQFSPKLGFAYHLAKDTTLRGSLGKGFSAPSLSELYSSIMRGTLFMECNPSLKPEEVFSYDLGIEKWFLNAVHGTITFYRSDARDYIGYITVNPNYRRKDNISKVKIKGVETELKWNITDKFSCFANHTYNRSEIVEYEPDSSIEGNFLPETTTDKSGIGLSFSNAKLFDSNVTFNYMDKRYYDTQNTQELEDYYTVDLKISRKIVKYCILSLGVENLFDKKYTIYKGVPQDVVSPGRTITSSVKIKF